MRKMRLRWTEPIPPYEELYQLADTTRLAKCSAYYTAIVAKCCADDVTQVP